MKETIVLTTFFILGIIWIAISASIDKERMKIEYCYDSNGQHYVAPNDNCNH